VAISKVTLPLALAVNYEDGDVDYFTEFDPVYYEVMNRPLRNLAYRDKMVHDKQDDIIDAINDAAGNKPSLHDYLRVAHDDDGNLKPGPVTINLDDLNDVTAVPTAAGYLLEYDGAEWVATAPDSITLTLDDLDNVNITGPAATEVLKYDGAEWVNEEAALDELGDTDIVGVADKDILTYDSGTSKWQNLAFEDELDALTGANSPSSTNVFATMDDVGDLEEKIADAYVLYVGDELTTDYGVAHYNTLSEAIDATTDSGKRPSGWSDISGTYRYRIAVLGNATWPAALGWVDPWPAYLYIDTTQGHITINTNTAPDGGMRVTNHFGWLGNGHRDLNRALIPGNPATTWLLALQYSGAVMQNVSVSDGADELTLRLDQGQVTNCRIYSTDGAAVYMNGDETAMFRNGYVYAAGTSPVKIRVYEGHFLNSLAECDGASTVGIMAHTNSHVEGCKVIHAGAAATAIETEADYLRKCVGITTADAVDNGMGIRVNSAAPEPKLTNCIGYAVRGIGIKVDGTRAHLTACVGRSGGLVQTGTLTYDDMAGIHVESLGNHLVDCRGIGEDPGGGDHVSGFVVKGGTVGDPNFVDNCYGGANGTANGLSLYNHVFLIQSRGYHDSAAAGTDRAIRVDGASTLTISRNTAYNSAGGLTDTFPYSGV
jgi:hypothetical protein